MERTYLGRANLFILHISCPKANQCIFIDVQAREGERYKIKTIKASKQRHNTKHIIKTIRANRQKHRE